MANAIYPKAKEQLLQGGINMSSGTVKVALIDTADACRLSYSCGYIC